MGCGVFYYLATIKNDLFFARQIVIHYFTKKKKCIIILTKTVNSGQCYIINMYVVIWQYRLWSFQGRDTNLERLLATNQFSQMKSLNFVNWCNGEVSKSAKI